MRKLAIITNAIKDEGQQMAQKIKKLLQESYRIEDTPICDLLDAELVIPEDTEALIVLGGDGSMLSVAARTRHLHIPLIGINLGGVGYLNEVEISDVEKAIGQIVQDKVTSEPRMMLAGSCSIGGEVTDGGVALNDIVLSRHGEAQMVGYRIYVNDTFLCDFHADGVIIATPTGSTAYNLSAGGPVVEPSARLILLTPVCPHNINNRSIILSPEDHLTVEILPSRSNKGIAAAVYVDGRTEGILSQGDRVEICMAGIVTNILKLSRDSFLNILHEKLSR